MKSWLVSKFTPEPSTGIKHTHQKLVKCYGTGNRKIFETVPYIYGDILCGEYFQMDSITQNSFQPIRKLARKQSVGTSESRENQPKTRYRIVVNNPTFGKIIENFSLRGFSFKYFVSFNQNTTNSIDKPENFKLIRPFPT